MGSETRAQLLECFTSIGHKRDRANFVCVKFSGVEVNESHLGTLKCCHRRGSEIGIARADADNQVRFASEAIGGKSPSGAHSSHLLRMIPCERTLAGLRLAHRNSSSFGKIAERRTRFAHEYAAAGDNEWFAA